MLIFSISSIDDTIQSIGEALRVLLWQRPQSFPAFELGHSNLAVTVHEVARALSGKRVRISCDPSRSRGEAPALNPIEQSSHLTEQVEVRPPQYLAQSRGRWFV